MRHAPRRRKLRQRMLRVRSPVTARLRHLDKPGAQRQRGMSGQPCPGRRRPRLLAGPPDRCHSFAFGNCVYLGDVVPRLNLSRGSHRAPPALFFSLADSRQAEVLATVTQYSWPAISTIPTSPGCSMAAPAPRETRKLARQALHKSWRKEYRALKQRRPEKPDVWYSQQIAKTDIGKGRSAEAIRKHMKH